MKLRGEHYFTKVAWSKADEVMVTWLNRKQNDLRISFCSVITGVCEIAQMISTGNDGWIDTSLPISFNSDGQKYLMTLSADQGGTAGKFKHLAIYDRSTGTARMLTSGLWEVIGINGWDLASEIAYFTGTVTERPAARHLYSVSTATGGSNVVTCISCGTTNVNGKECTSNSASFSRGLSYFVHNCDGCGTLQVPRSVIRDTNVYIQLYNFILNKVIKSNCIQSGTEVFIAAENQDLHDRLAQKAQPRTLAMVVPVTGGYKAQVRLLLPPTINKNAGKASKFPLLVSV